MKNYSSRPFVTVVITAHEGDIEYLPRCLASIARQSLSKREIEVLLAFDGKPSPLAEKVMDGAADASGITPQLFAADEATGYYTMPRNRVTPFARGHYIAPMDVDNEMAPGHLAGLLRSIRTALPKQGWPHFVYSRREYVHDEGAEAHLPKGPSPLTPWTKENVQSLLQGARFNFVDTGDMLVPLSVLHELAARTGCMWNAQVRRFGDYDLVFRMQACGFRGRAVDQVTNIYHWTGSNLQVTRQAEELATIPESMYLEAKKRGWVRED